MRGTKIKRAVNTMVYHSGTYFSQPKQFAEERQDIIFRRVRGILNKITPETFDKLSKELVNVGLDSPRTLRGLIYLLFDKALKDLKYSSLYAKLCQELSERSPNFEKESGPNTFCKFLISKCEDEFERRRKATEDFDSKHELTDEEFEQKIIAKQKMLGNIKFICELGKKRLLQEEILHECIRGLLSKKKKERSLQDQAQDLECLCQIMRTIGSLLDIDASKNLMNQYFERIDMYSKKPDLPSRIRFMLKDVIDLRNNNWRPRPFQREDNVPQPLSKLREETGFNNTSSNSQIDILGNTKNRMNMGDLSRLHGGKLSALLLDDDEPGFTTTTDFHWGSSAFLPHENEFDIFSPSISSTYNNGSTIVNPIRTANATAPTPQTTTTVSKSNQKNHQNLNAPIAPRFLQKNRFESNVVDSAQNHYNHFVDPFSNSYKGRVDYPEGAANLNDNLGKRNDNVVERHNVRGSEKRLPTTRDGPPVSRAHAHLDGPTMKRNDMDSTVSQLGRDDYFRCNNIVRNLAPQPLPPHANNRRTSIDHDDPQPLHMSRRPFGDLPKPLPPNRINDIPPGQKNAFMHLSSADMLPPHPSHRPSSPQHMINNQQLRSHPDHNQHHLQPLEMNQGHRQNLNSPRRFERGREHDGPERQPRQPKFSGANYRLPGQSRPNPPSQHNRHPESDLNFNWRSADSTKTEQATKDSEVNQPSQKPVDLQNVNKNVGNGMIVSMNSGLSSNNKSSLAIQKTGEPRFEAADLNYAIKDKREVNYNDHKTSQGGLRSPSPKLDRITLQEAKRSLNNNNPADQPRNNINHSRRFNDPDSVSNSEQQHPRNYGSRRSGPQERTGFSERKEARDQIRSQQPTQQRSEARQDSDSNQRSQNMNQFGKGGYRPPVGRNKSFERRQSPDSRTGNSWRNDVSNLVNSINSKKDAQPTSATVSTSVLPKPPTRMSETDFSLRPSHNLVGRALTDSASKLNNNIDLAREIINTKNPDVKPSVCLVDNVKVQMSTLPQVQTQIQTQTQTQTQIQAQTNSQIQALTQSQTQIQGQTQSNPRFKELEALVGSRDNVAKSLTASQSVSKFMAIFTKQLIHFPSDSTKMNTRIKELKIPKEFHVDCLVAAMKHSIVRSELDCENTSKLLSQLIPTVFEPSVLHSVFTTILKQMEALEIETPKVKSLVAGFLSRSVVDGSMSIEEVAQFLVGGKHHPLFLLLLQKLERKAGQSWLNEKFTESKVNLMNMLPEVDRTRDRLASALKDRCLGFLDPMLTIEPDLWEQMRDRDPSPAAIYRWIKDNVDQTIQSTPTFAQVFISCLLKYIYNTTLERGNNINNNNNTQKDSDSSDSNKSSPTNSSSQCVNDQEKELLSRYQQVMQAILKDKQMQLATLYSLQLFYHKLDFPKGALLRWFHMLYDLSIVDDDVFFIWKEEINDKVPGKGQALFQVNTWLNWLAVAESEDEEDV